MQEPFRGQLKVLYESLYETMIQVAYRMTGSVETAQDLVQETFLQIGRAHV